MPRPISWLARLHEIRRSVANSVRSHYSRRDLELLFELQPRAAQKIVELLPTVPVGTSHMVGRDDLSTFLERVHETDDTTGLFEQMRREKAPVVRRKLRTLVCRDAEPVTLTSLPQSITLSRGRLEVSFATVLQLAEAMYAIAQVIETEGFANNFEPQIPAPEPSDDTEIRTIFEELECMEAANQVASSPSIPIS